MSDIISQGHAENARAKKAASDYGEQYGKEAGKFVERDSYIDDGLKFLSSPELAFSLIESTKALCKMRGFKLYQFISNHKSRSMPFPRKIIAKIQSLDLINDTLQVERALSVQWRLEPDTVQSRGEMKAQPLTRRGILSTVSSDSRPIAYEMRAVEK